MKTKIVYVLLSNQTDYYTEQMLLSIISLKSFHPDAYITLVTNNETAIYLKEYWGEYEYLISEVLILKIPDGLSQMPASRYLKIKLRDIIKGDFLYLDNDTLVTGNLSQIDDLKYDLAAVPNGHNNRQMCSFLKKYLKVTHKKLENPNIPYFNGGVIYAKDNETTNRFFSKWLELWRLDFQKWGIRYDQPTLGLANKECGYIIKSLPDIYNCQILIYHAKPFIFKAKIFHYYYNFRKSDVFPLNRQEILEEFRHKGLTLRLKSIIENPLDAFLNNCKILSSEEFKIINTPLCRAAFKLSNKFEWTNQLLSLIKRTVL